MLKWDFHEDIVTWKCVAHCCSFAWMLWSMNESLFGLIRILLLSGNLALSQIRAANWKWRRSKMYIDDYSPNRYLHIDHYYTSWYSKQPQCFLCVTLDISARTWHKAQHVHHLSKKERISRYKVLTIEVSRSNDRHIYIMGIRILIKRCLWTETVPGIVLMYWRRLANIGIPIIKTRRKSYTWKDGRYIEYWAVTLICDDDFVHAMPGIPGGEKSIFTVVIH